MKRVDPILLVFLSIITFGIYALVWYVSTKHQANALGAKIPTCWLIILPIIDFYWMWKFCEGIEYVTNKKVEGVISFLAIMFLSVIGMAIVQNGINNAFSETAQSYQAPAQSYQAPQQTYNAPSTIPPPPGGSAGPPTIPPPPAKL
jgi:hypothetical protein